MKKFLSIFLSPTAMFFVDKWKELSPINSFLIVVGLPGEKKILSSGNKVFLVFCFTMFVEEGDEISRIDTFK